MDYLLCQGRLQGGGWLLARSKNQEGISTDKEKEVDPARIGMCHGDTEYNKMTGSEI